MAKEMELHDKLHNRRSIRLPGYDYAQAGAYFITICSYDRLELFGEIIDGTMRLSEFGSVVKSAWDDLPSHYSHVITDAIIIMPNHIHGIVVLVGAGLKPAPTKAIESMGPKKHALPEIIRGLKTFSSRRINERRHTLGIPVWQRGYFEHVIRDDGSINRIREYIAQNPMHWDIDRENRHPKLTPFIVAEENAPWEI
jgi:REP element-mobilizing transposase RayT